MLKELLTYILLLLFPKEEVYTKEFEIYTSQIPQHIYWIDDINILLSSYGYTEIYNIYTRKSNTIDTCDTCIYGYDRGFIYCKYEHREIQSMEEFSTTVYIYNIDGELLYSKDLFPTVIPIVCLKDYVVLESAYSFLEQKRYLLKNDVLKEVSYIKKKEIFKGIEGSNTVVSKRKDSSKVIVLDEYTRLWLYGK